MPVFALCFLLGNMLVHQLPMLLAPGYLAVLALTGGLLSLPKASRALACFLAGIIWTTVCADVRLEHRLPTRLDGEDVELRGWIDGFPDIGEDRAVFSLRVTSVEDEPIRLRRLRLTWYDDFSELRPGAALRLQARLRRPRGLLNPGGFDYERWLYVENYSATGYVRKGAVDLAQRRGIAARWLTLRARIGQRIAAAATSDVSAALITALSVGDRSGFSDANWSVFRRTGTSHLVAISGLHIGLVATFVFALASYCVRRLRRFAVFDIELAGLAAVGAALAYAALAGFALPTQRALLMCLFAFVVLVSRRYVRALHAISAACIVVLLFDPIATLSASFWLSFIAVAALVVLFGPYKSSIAGRLADRSRSLWWQQLVKTQIMMSIVLLPLVIGLFGEFSLMSIGINLVAIPVFSFVLVPATLLACVWAALSITSLEGIHWLSIFADSVFELLATAASMPWAAMPVTVPSAWPLALAVAGVCLALPWHEFPGRRVAWLAAIPLLWAAPDRPPRGLMRMTVLDVGHGLAVIVETHAHRLLFDAGPVSRSGFDTGREIVVPALQASAGYGLDALIISHSDNDHSGGALSVLDVYPSADVLYGPDVSHVAGTACRAGQRWRWDGVEFAIVHPSTEFLPQGNDSSCVLRIVSEHGAVLLTGDIEARGERAIVGTADLRADVVVVPHHGSTTSSTAGFVAEVQPRVALVSAAFNNRWGFPRAEVQQRWQAGGADVQVTGSAGAIHVAWRRGRLQVHGERRIRRRYWRA